jgi:hypothetical protein
MEQEGPSLSTSIDHTFAAPSRVASKRPIIAILATCALGFLAVAVLEVGFASSLAKIGWVTVTTALGALDPGTGVALYLAGAGVYSPRHFAGWGSFNERPDNYAAVGLVVAFCVSLLATASRPQAGPVPLLVGTLLVYTLSSTAVLGQFDRETFAWFVRALGFPLFLFVVLAVGRRQLADLPAPLGVLLAVGAFMASVSLLEAIGARSLILPAWINDPSVNTWLETGRSGGTLMQAEFNGLALTLLGILSVGFGWSGGGGRRAVGWAAAGLMTVGIFVCYTRAPWLGALLAAGILSFAGGGPRRKRRVFARLGILLALVVIVVAIPNRFVRERARDRDTVEFRLKLWGAGLRMAAERPLLGYGFGQFQAEVGSFIQSTGNVKDEFLKRQGGVAHNTFLSVLVWWGGIGLLLYCATIWCVLREGLRGARLVWPSHGTALVLALSAAYFVNGLAVNLIDAFTNCLFFGSMGLFAGASRERTGV